MSETGKYLMIGPYRLTLPEGTEASVRFSEVNKNVPNRELMTFWKITLDKFYIGIHLDTRLLSELKSFIDYTTKSDVVIKEISVGNIKGVAYGSYDKPRTWIDWWFRIGDLTLCMNLQSVKLPYEKASSKDKAMHRALIESLVYNPSKVT